MKEKISKSTEYNKNDVEVHCHDESVGHVDFSDKYLALKGIMQNPEQKDAPSASSLLHTRLKGFKTKDLCHELLNRFLVATFLSFQSNDEAPKNKP